MLDEGLMLLIAIRARWENRASGLVGGLLGSWILGEWPIDCRITTSCLTAVVAEVLVVTWKGTPRDILLLDLQVIVEWSTWIGLHGEASAY